MYIIFAYHRKDHSCPVENRCGFGFCHEENERIIFFHPIPSLLLLKPSLLASKEGWLQVEKQKSR